MTFHSTMSHSPSSGQGHDHAKDRNQPNWSLQQGQQTNVPRQYHADSPFGQSARPPHRKSTYTHPGPMHYPPQGPTPPPIRLMGSGQPPPPMPPGFSPHMLPSRPPSGGGGGQRPNNHQDRSNHHQFRHDQRNQTFGPNQFPLYPLDRFQVKCAPFRQPTEIGSFSYDEQRNFVMDDSQLVKIL